MKRLFPFMRLLSGVVSLCRSEREKNISTSQTPAAGHLQRVAMTTTIPIGGDEVGRNEVLWRYGGQRGPVRHTQLQRAFLEDRILKHDCACFAFVFRHEKSQAGTLTRHAFHIMRSQFTYSYLEWHFIAKVKYRYAMSGALAPPSTKVKKLQEKKIEYNATVRVLSSIARQSFVLSEQRTTVTSLANLGEASLGTVTFIKPQVWGRFVTCQTLTFETALYKTRKCIDLQIQLPLRRKTLDPQFKHYLFITVGDRATLARPLCRVCPFHY